MRAQEPMGMKWAEVRLDLRILRLPARRTKGKEPKSITLDGDLLKLIQEQRKLHDRKFPSGEHVFPDAEGNPVNYDRAIDQFQAACKRAGIAEGFTTWDGQTRKPGFHDLRRTFAREADRCGVPHDEIMNIARWKTHVNAVAIPRLPERFACGAPFPRWTRRTGKTANHVILKSCQGRRGDGMADVTDLKSVGGLPPCGFDSRPRHHIGSRKTHFKK
jgi:Phage integrase family